MKKVLVTSKSCGSGIGREEVKELFARQGIEADLYELDKVRDSLRNYEGIVVGIDSFGEEEFAGAENLKVIMKYGVGLENIDRDCADRRGIQVKNMPGVNSRGSGGDGAFPVVVRSPQGGGGRPYGTGREVAAAYRDLVKRKDNWYCGYGSYWQNPYSLSGRVSHDNSGVRYVSER